MRIRKEYKFRLNTNLADEALSRQYASCNCFVWNKVFALQKERLDNKQRCLPYTKLANLLPDWKQKSPLLSETQSFLFKKNQFGDA
jgi:hypothetical protein